MEPTALHVYDFDGSLYSSPGPPKGKSSVWYYHAHSLDPWLPPGYDKRWHMNIVLAARRSGVQPDTLTALLSGRPAHNDMKHKLKSMSSSAGLHFDVMQLKPVPTALSDSAFKSNAVRAWLRRLPSVKSVTFYDDLPENLEAVGAAVRRAGRSFTGVLTPGFLFP